MKNNLTRRDFLELSLQGVLGASLTGFPIIARAINFPQRDDPVIFTIDRTRARLESQVNTLLSRYLKNRNIDPVQASKAFVELNEMGARTSAELARAKITSDPRMKRVPGFEDQSPSEMWAFTTYGEFVEIENKTFNQLNRSPLSSKDFKAPGMNPNGIRILLAKILGALLSIKSNWIGEIVKFINDVIDKGWIEKICQYIQEKLWDKLKEFIKWLVIQLIVEKRKQLSAFLTRLFGKWVAASWFAIVLSKMYTGVGMVIAIAQMVIGVFTQRNAILGI
jgi:hypothetical protein